MGANGRRFLAWCAGLACAGASVVVGCRAADTDGITPVPQMLAFLPWLLVPTGLGVLCALLARWWPGLLWGAVLLGLLAWFLEPYGTAGAPGGPAVASVRVLAANVEFGNGTPALIAAVRRERPDVVFVSECDPACEARLGANAGYPHREAVPGTGSTGSLILSRFPLRGTGGVPGTMGMPGAVADVRGHAVRLQLAHPMPPVPGQVGVWREELAALRDFAARGGDAPTILAGDFNASQDHASFRRVLDAGLRDAARLTDDDRTPTWPSRTAPALGVQIDHVLVSREFSARRTRFLDLADTDHRAVLADLTLHGPG
ncbi:endonuclease/exonuclease/phosphatase family protein [Streptomyces sp. YS415]|uniref:endonuclease/exonuclease/phosphatase family protein n=1 Tax=Streptomyces sp. YS415 TaxID=2944806 RepID=UPI00201FD887|nr:endonuclease/exonuclease/phosphatase family protein [Streptomyces sp. YS415]MCL7428900.1 endonuclease/exonuclease/phosphatase family protein [Streptomyces sp. YS415]